MKRYRVRMIWIKFDDNKDGLAELSTACASVGTSCSKEQPHASLSPRWWLYRPLTGMSRSPLLTSSTTSSASRPRSCVRAWTIFISRTIPRTFVTGKINLDDALVSRPGGIVRGEDGAIFGQDIAPLVTPFVFPQAMEGLEYMDQVRENRTGTNRYFTGIDQNAMNKTATGIQQLSTMAASVLSRSLASWRAVLRTCSRSFTSSSLKRTQGEVVKLNNNWVEIDPAQWKKRTDFKISVGYAAGNKDALMQKLMMLSTQQMQAMQLGLPVVNPKNIYETNIELTKAADFSAPNRFWTDPATVPPPQPPQPDVTVMAAEQIRQQTQVKTTQLETEQRERDSIRDAQLKQMEIETGAQVKLGLAHIQSEHQAQLDERKTQSGFQLEAMRAELNPKTKEVATKDGEAKQNASFVQQFMQSQEQQTRQIAQMMQQFIETLQKMNGPKKVIRGKDGRVDSVVPAE
jgi:hypothetical protein